MKARKLGYDVAYARTTVRTPTTCKPMPNVRLFWQESLRPPACCEAEPTKESIKTKTESGNCFCIRVVLSIKLRLIVMSTNLNYRERESRATGRRSSTRKGPEQERKNKRRHFLLEEQHELL